LRMRCVPWILACLSYPAFGQAPDVPFTVTWLQGTCVGCKVAADLGRVQWVSRNEAWGIGWSWGHPQGSGDYIVVHTVDAGKTWKELLDTWQHAGPPALSFLDASHGWFSCSNMYCTEAPGMEVRRTTDGGKHWNIITHEAAVLGMAFADERHGIAQAFDVGDPVVRTADGGQTWSRIEIPNLKKIEVVFLLSGRTAWVTDHEGDDLLLFRTIDGGQSWEGSRTSLPYDWPEVREILFVDQANGWIVLGRKQDDEIRLLGTTDGGRTWTPVSIPSVRSGTWIPAPDVLGFVSAKVGFVFSTEDEGQPSWDPKNRKVLFTTDGGARWQEYALPYSISRCQALGGDLVCSADRKGSHFGILRLHPK